MEILDFAPTTHGLGKVQVQASEGALRHLAPTITQKQIGDMASSKVLMRQQLRVALMVPRQG